MQITMYKLHYGNYSFVAEFDSTSEIGKCELGLWYREKLDIHTIPLQDIPRKLLLKALTEPYRGLLLPQLEARKAEIHQKMESAVKEFLRPIRSKEHPQPRGKLPRAVKKQTRQLRKKYRRQIQQLEQTFYQQEILALERHCFNLDIIAPDYHAYGDWHYVRTFYFEEVNSDNIHTFCREFAQHPHYRAEILAGEKRWNKRNALFVHNLPAILNGKSTFVEDGSTMRQAREFFRWLDINTDAILAHPDYQHLQALDHTCHNKIIASQPELDAGETAEPAREVDPELRLAVNTLRNMPGVTYLGSCQGISGKIHFQQYDIMAITPHQEHGHITFGTLSYLLHDLIMALLPQFPAITTQYIPHRFIHTCTLYARDNNLQFRTEIQMMTTQIRMALTNIQHQEYIHADPIKQTSRWEEARYPHRYAPTQEAGGLLPSRRAWLCQPEQIEQTLHLLYHLNHWAKASDRLFYSDRQGLYRVKAELIREAYQQGQLQTSGYIDGSAAFRQDLDIELAIDMAIELIMDIDVATINEFGLSSLDKKALELYQLVTGHDGSIHPPQEQEREQLETYLLTTLGTLIQNAQRSRQPIHHQALTDLLIMPADLLHISWERARYISSWDDLDESDLRKIDPEGWSLVAFRYEHEKTRYTFHLPYRVAERFMAPENLKNLSSIARESNEYGVYYGRPITEEESEQYPIAEILWELCVYTDGVCPRKLERKDQHHYTSPTQWHYYEEQDNPDGEEDDDILDCAES